MRIPMWVPILLALVLCPMYWLAPGVVGGVALVGGVACVTVVLIAFAEDRGRAWVLNRRARKAGDR